MRKDTSLLNDLFKLEGKGQFRPTVVISLSPTTLYAPLSPVRQKGKSLVVLSHRRGFGSKDKIVIPTRPVDINKLLTGSRDSEGKEKEPEYADHRVLEKNTWKSRKNNSKMVLGRDVGLKEVSSLSLLAMVGHFSY
jgi:hypothetical protein